MYMYIHKTYGYVGIWWWLSPGLEGAVHPVFLYIFSVPYPVSNCDTVLTATAVCVSGSVRGVYPRSLRECVEFGFKFSNQ